MRVPHSSFAGKPKKSDRFSSSAAFFLRIAWRDRTADCVKTGWEWYS